MISESSIEWTDATWNRERDLYWPLPNVWLGVSIERDDYVHRIEDLQACPAAVRFLSLEPLLGPLPDLDLGGISWVIVGGESGPGARPMDLDWVRDIREQCRSAGVACFVKQLGRVWGREHLADPKGGDTARWPADLRVREMPHERRGAAESHAAEVDL